MRHAPHPLTLRQLQYAVAVADEKSFRRAAELCHVAQPSLSAQIAQLEDALGVVLFERDRTRTLLTAAGAEVVERARHLLVAADDLVASAQRHADPSTGTLRLGIIPTIAPYLLPEAASRLRAKYPHLTLVWLEDKTSALASLLQKGELDGAVVALEAELGDVASAVIGTDPFVLVTPRAHPLGAARRLLRPGDLDGHRVLLLDDGHCLRDQALAVCSKSGVEELGFRATSLTTLAQMVAGGAGVTLLPTLALAAENRRGELAVRAFAPRAPARTLALVWRTSSPLRASLDRVAEVLRAAHGAVTADSAKLSRA